MDIEQWDAGQLRWEEIGPREEPRENGPYVITDRAAVPGGWLVRVIAYTYDGLPSLGVGITFVPNATVTP
jgi:hypothetical protein